MQYSIFEISGRQYKISPGEVIEIDHQAGEEKKLKLDKVLLSMEDGKIEIGNPYLKKSLTLEVVGESKSKIRVATYKAKSNYRRVIGQKKILTKVKLAEEDKPVKKA